MRKVNPSDVHHRFFRLTGALVLLFMILLHFTAIGAAEAKFRLDSPASGSIKVTGEFRLSGITDFDELLVVLSCAEVGFTKLYAQQWIAVHEGRFDTWIWLPWGSGEYTVAAWGSNRGTNAYSKLACFQVTATSDTESTQALPVKLGAFDVTAESILQPAQVYSRVAGRLPLHIKTKYAELWLEIRKDGVVVGKRCRALRPRALGSSGC